MMGVIADTELAILNAVKSVVTDVPVYSLSSRKSISEMPLKDVVLIGFSGASYGENLSMTPNMVQRMRLRFSVLITHENIRGVFEKTSEVYDRIERIVDALSGLKTPAGTVTVHGIEVREALEGVMGYIVQLSIDGSYEKTG